jgi:hypothetical protein
MAFCYEKIFAIISWLSDSAAARTCFVWSRVMKTNLQYRSCDFIFQRLPQDIRQDFSHE